MIDYELNGKRALVTGGSSGMGKCAAIKLAREGVNVLIVSRSEEKLASAVKEINESSDSKIEYMVGDVKEPTLANRAVQKVKDLWGGCDILVNNAGGPPMKNFLECDDESWDEALQQNLMSVVRLSKAALPDMLERKWGRIINITSTLAKEPTPPMILSATARAAVSVFTKSIATEFASKGVTVNTLCPGGVLTERLHSLVESAAVKQNITFNEALENSQKIIPMGRFASVDEFADTLLFLASERARYLTGLNLMVDGGLTKSAF